MFRRSGQEQEFHYMFKSGIFYEMSAGHEKLFRGVCLMGVQGVQRFMTNNACSLQKRFLFKKCVSAVYDGCKLHAGAAALTIHSDTYPLLITM